MALQSLPNQMGIIVHSDHGLATANLSGTILNAAGEYREHVGTVCLEGGVGSSKTFSGAGGGRIRWRSGASAVFADAGTTIRVGVMDVGTDGYGDATFDVYKDLVGATDTITSSADQITGMSTGTKTITHGDKIAVRFTMSSVGGTDSVQVTGMSVGVNTRQTTANYPYVTASTGTPGKTNAGMAGCAIEFDDGTLGWIEPLAIAPGIFATLSTTVNTGTTPDEVAAVFQFPFKCRISGGYFQIGSIASTDTFEIVLYSTPLGTPTVVETITIDPDFTGGTALAPYYFKFATARELSINTDYAIAVRPTSANSVTVGYYDFTSGYEKYKTIFPFGNDLFYMGRTNQTGAFASIQDYYMPMFGITIDKLDDGASAGGGGGVIIGGF